MKAQEVIAEAVKAIRQKRQWTQADMARHLGYSQPTISKLERGAKCSDSIEKSLLFLLSERSREVTPLLHIRKRVFNVNQTEFAALANASQAAVSRWENEQTFPTLNEMRAIREAAFSRGIEWNDDWFYSLPTDASTDEGSATAA